MRGVKVWRMVLFEVVARVLLAGVLAACGTRTSPTSTPSSPPAPQPSAATPIDLDLVDANITDALNEIAFKAKINLSVSADVRGTVTMQVRAMPWDQALASLAKQHGLRVDRTNVMLVVFKHAGPSSHTFTGTPIEARFEDTPIREVVRVFAAHANVAITVDDNVQVAVTQRMRNLPWDFVLDHIARKYELRLVREGTALRITR
jgi:type II secretory pathway component HofQ